MKKTDVTTSKKIFFIVFSLLFLFIFFFFLFKDEIKNFFAEPYATDKIIIEEKFDMDLRPIAD